MIKVIVIYEDGESQVEEFLTDGAAAVWAFDKAEQLGVEPVKDRQGDWAVIE